jgi:hypothetical protein
LLYYQTCKNNAPMSCKTKQKLTKNIKIVGKRLKNKYRYL